MFKQLTKWAFGFGGVAVLGMSLLAQPASYAQDDDGLSEEELAQLTLVTDVFTRMDSYTSYVTNGLEKTAVVFTINLADTTLISTTDNIIVREVTTIRDGDTINQRQFVSLTTEEKTDDVTNQSYTLITDTVLVDGVLYIKPTYLVNVNGAELWEDWQAFTAEDTLPEPFTTLDLDKSFSLAAHPFSDYTMLSEAVSSITYTEVPNQEGILFDSYTLTIDGDGFWLFNQVWLGLETAPPTGENDSGMVNLNVVLTKDGDLLYYTYDITVSFNDLDGSGISEDLSEATVDIEITENAVITIDNINAELEPITIPE